MDLKATLMVLAALFFGGGPGGGALAFWPWLGGGKHELKLATCVLAR